ncbi:hypothetical protein HPB50_018774 [Hyalomma asiaticum]|uniref:Uncharacterized protein n=1 Tax=Hyalomma asiaticum TaxID=266040 RepID=A0ACB7S1F4_HYAAI|nr:hypothetical protein HPB50_018774 [Hyalomma asiaticum]
MSIMAQDKPTEPSSDEGNALEHEPTAISARPRRTTTLSAKAQANYEASREEHRCRTDAAWECVEDAILKLSNASEEVVDNAAAQLRSNYERYRNLAAKYTAFLAATQTHESRRELKLLSAIDADRDVVVKEGLREDSDQSRNRIEETASQCSLRTSSRASFVSQRSNSSMSIAAAQARAQADASRARAAFSRREAAMRLEKAKIEAELEILQQEREVAAAEAQANALEAAAEQDGGEGSRLTPPVDPTLRTVSFAAEQEDLSRAFQSPQHPVRSVTRHQNDSVPLSGAATGHGTSTGIHAGQAQPTHDTINGEIGRNRGLMFKKSEVVLLKDGQAAHGDWPTGVVTRCLLSAHVRVRRMEPPRTHL